jgi:hypothetical protein
VHVSIQEKLWMQGCVGTVSRVWWPPISNRLSISRLVDKSNFSDARRVEPSVCKRTAMGCLRQLFGITQSTPQHLSLAFRYTPKKGESMESRYQLLYVNKYLDSGMLSWFICIYNDQSRTGIRVWIIGYSLHDGPGRYLVIEMVQNWLMLTKKLNKL